MVLHVLAVSGGKLGLMYIVLLERVDVLNQGNQGLTWLVDLIRYNKKALSIQINKNVFDKRKRNRFIIILRNILETNIYIGELC